MFAVFLAATAAAVSAFLAVLLLRPTKKEPPLHVPWGAAAVAVMAVGLTAWGIRLL